MDLIIAISQSRTDSWDTFASVFTHSTKLNSWLKRQAFRASRQFLSSLPGRFQGTGPRIFALDLWPLIPGQQNEAGLSHLGPGAVCLPVELWVSKHIQGHVAGSYGHILLS